MTTEHRAGRDLDSLVAEKVMGRTWDETLCRVCGWPIVPDGETGCWSSNCSMRPLPLSHADAPRPYSIDPAAAWQVVERMREDGWQCVISSRADGWYVLFERGHDSIDAEADTMPLAVCRAALAAITSKEKP